VTGHWSRCTLAPVRSTPCGPTGTACSRSVASAVPEGPVIRGRVVVGLQPDEWRHGAPSAVAPVSRLEGRRVRRYNNPLL